MKYCFVNPNNNLKARFDDNEKVNISILKLNIFRFYLFTVKFVSEILF